MAWLVLDLKNERDLNLEHKTRTDRDISTYIHVKARAARDNGWCRAELNQMGLTSSPLVVSSY